MPLWNDFRYAARQLRSSPGFTLTVLATLGLCIGANTAIYSVVDAVLLRPLPYPEADKLSLVGTAWQRGGSERWEDRQNGTQFEAVRDGVPALDVAAFSGSSGANFTSGAVTQYVSQQRVSSGFFRVLGVAPEVGREFSATEDRVGGPAIAVLSHAFWKRACHGDPQILGSAIRLRGEPFTVVGIMPAAFRVDVPVDVWTPLRPSRTGEGTGTNYQVAARLKPGTAPAQVEAQLQSVSKILREIRKSPAGVTFEERLQPFQKAVAGDSGTELLLTWAAVSLVLLIGCANVAGLLLTRAARRRREIATRLAIGGSRGAVIRQLLAESVLLALTGGALGIVLGQFALQGLKSLGAGTFELWHPLQLDFRVLAAMLGVALLTSLVFGLVPAFEASRVDIRSVLVEGGRGTAGGRRSWIRNLLVTAEVALSLVLLVGAGLLTRSLAYLTGLNPGFETHGVFTAQTSLEDARYQDHDKVNRLYNEGLARIRRIPGVESASVALSLPYERPLNDGFRTLDGASNDREQDSESVYITPEYFQTMRIPILSGRGFRDADTGNSRKVVVISAAFARRYYPGVDALGRHLDMGQGAAEIVGVVGDVQQHSGMGDFGPLSVQPTLYRPAAQLSDPFVRLVHTWFPPKWVIRAQGQPASLAAQIQQAVAAVDPQLPLAKFAAIDELRFASTREQRYHAGLFMTLAGLAMLLAAVGLYGLIASSVTERTREFGIRMALGAPVRAAMTSAMRPGMLAALAGGVVGGGMALAAVRLLRNFLWGVQPFDPSTFAITVILLLAVALMATALPALRLLSLDPSKTLRDE